MESRPNPPPASAPSRLVGPHKMSSLQRAAGASASHRNAKYRSSALSKKKKTSYTIGGSSTLEAKTTTSSSYSNDPPLKSQDGMESRTQQQHSHNYTVGNPQHEQDAPSHNGAYQKTVENDHMMEDDPMSPYNQNNNNHGYNHGNSSHQYHRQPIPHASLGPLSPTPEPPTSFIIGGSSPIPPSHQYQQQPIPHPSQPISAPPTYYGDSSPLPPLHHYQQQPIPYSSPGPIPPAPATQTSYAIGGSSPASQSRPQSVEKMEGVQDHGSKTPLVVLDGANVAHYYADALAAMNTTFSDKSRRRGKPEPDTRGIQVATDYFLSVGVRVLVVLPQYWMRKKPRPGDTSSQNAMMDTNQMDILKDLNDKGLIVASPPADDDDAYALTIAKREEMRAVRQRNGEGPGFVLSNDMFRDAQARDPTGVMKEWLKEGRNETIGPGRISYAFCDMGTMDDHGDRILDFVPNPRHPLVIYVEGLHHQTILNR
ncbi:unnamed protein product [Cylindrotheca closterium]|uniref:RNase NYN domain-containing protein n=1 Tax=Cylindrotheca closterium TaxID=2856 RepID=A0AAD2FQH1_9STRA|nr:unnamed protein product [Cylindrotheca closterium]